MIIEEVCLRIFRIITHQGEEIPTTSCFDNLRGTMYDVGGSSGRLCKRKACFIVASRLYIQLDPDSITDEFQWMIISFNLILDGFSSSLGVKGFKMR